ncbi:hypothetical protein ONZ43_g4737 [Nemania bipapillata]|uniref:Uncharacterized protein n=1 Tax=Nemania bipapillata TaxID=110536 RepID=A0ACC2IIX6_9PEZI|nr:hypothetical protein ONZ43_g4737 [Nemania bipapillata]
MEQPPLVSNASFLRTIVNQYRPELATYEDFYRQVHQNPEISGMESTTAALVAQHLKSLNFEVHTGIGGHGVAAVFYNGPGDAVLMRAELDALPIEEKTNLRYKSTKRMIDRYGNERPIMHACGHDMNMAALLGASALLKAAAHKWSGTVIFLFQPDEEETGGAQAMVDDGLYTKIPVPNIMLAQHLVPSKSGTVAIRSGPALVAADSANVRIIGGPCRGVNPQQCVDPIPVAMKIVMQLEDQVRNEVGRQEDITIACWGFHAGLPGNDYVAYADFLLDIKTVKTTVQEKVHEVIRRIIEEKCKEANTPQDPVVTFAVRAPLTTNDPSVSEPISRVFAGYFEASSIEMQFTRACEDFSLLGAEHSVPYAYWNYGGSQTTEEPIPTNHSPFFAPVIQPTLQAGTDAMALAALTFLAKEVS